MMRTAISPRLATSTLQNIFRSPVSNYARPDRESETPASRWPPSRFSARPPPRFPKRRRQLLIADVRELDTHPAPHAHVRRPGVRLGRCVNEYGLKTRRTG